MKREIARSREWIVVGTIVAALVIFYVLQPGEDHLLTGRNLQAILLNISTDSLLVVGMTLAIVAGGFDLSVGATLMWSGIVCGELLAKGFGVPFAVSVALGTGLLVGWVNGVLVTRIGINPLIATLGTMTVVRGIALQAIQGAPITRLPESFTAFGQGTIGMPGGALVAVMLVVFVAADVLMNHARFFRQIYFVGGNEEAARLCGIDVEGVRTFTYMASGFLSALAGVLTTSRLGTASPTVGAGAELGAIAAAVIGGVTLSGGKGSILGACLGLLLVGVVDNGLEQIGMTLYAKQIAKGAILIVAVTLDRLSRERVRNVAAWLMEH
jgi:ribose transport system permease protein